MGGLWDRPSVNITVVREIHTVMFQKGENNMNENNECLVMGNCGMASLLIVGLLIGIIFVCIML